MALFGTKKPASAKASEGKEEKKAAVAQTSGTSVGHDVSHVLRHARITEKATMHSGAGVYTFDISEKATKREIIAAVKGLYKVTPLKVAVVTIPSKVRRNMRTGKSGVKQGGRKAYVYLKKGETITLG